jgi:rubrerythrin
VSCPGESLEAFIREKLEERFEAKLAEFTCPGCEILAVVDGQDRPFCPICGHDDFPQPVPTNALDR